jgi:glycosyltransferase involved in cell wall biosynthesis
LLQTLHTPVLVREPAVLKVPPEMALPKSFLLFMGRLSWEKGADLLPELARRFSHTQILVAGAGPLEDGIRSEAPANLKLLGQITGPFKDYLFEKASALLLCSRVPENAPLVILESQVAKLPVIFTPGGGVEEYLAWLGRSSSTLDGYEGQELPRRGSTPEDASLGSIAKNLSTVLEAERQAQ